MGTAQKIIANAKEEGRICEKILEILPFFGEKEIEIEIQKHSKKRTNQQNKALHLMFDFIASELNEAGFPFRHDSVFGKKTFEMDWDADFVKEFIWRPIQNLRTGKESTASLTHEELQKVYEEVARYFSQNGISIPFPSQFERQIENQILKI